MKFDDRMIESEVVRGQRWVKRAPLAGSQPRAQPSPEWRQRRSGWHVGEAESPGECKVFGRVREKTGNYISPSRI